MRCTTCTPHRSFFVPRARSGRRSPGWSGRCKASLSDFWTLRDHSAAKPHSMLQHATHLDSLNGSDHRQTPCEVCPDLLYMRQLVAATMPRWRVLLPCLLLGFGLTSLLPLQTTDEQSPIVVARSVIDTRSTEETNCTENSVPRHDASVVGASDAQNGERATVNITLTKDIRLRIDAGIISVLNSTSASGPSFSRRCQELFNASEDTRARRRKPTIMHIPKTAGTTLERFLGTAFTGHDPVKFRRKTGRFVTLYRHPVEWALSYYYFRKSGENQGNYKKHQAKFCVRGTGKAFPTPCVPKVSGVLERRTSKSYLVLAEWLFRSPPSP